MYKIAKEQLSALFAAIGKKMILYMPLYQNGQVNYGIWSQEQRPALEEVNTIKSPKDFFFPQSEGLYTCYWKEKKILLKPEELADQFFVIFGIRGCDIKGIQVLDRVFLADPEDSFYKNRREHGILISQACYQPDETCFCSVFGVEPQDPLGDITTWFVDEWMYWEPKTPKGEQLTKELPMLLEAGNEDLKKKEWEKERIQMLLEKLPYVNLSLDVFKEKEMLELFNSPKWKELYKTCLGCGICTFICPTCQCYDIRDFDTGHGVKRFRCWDSCMYSDFTLMAHGNIRKTQMERFRQRFMHKLIYFPENNKGMFSCVGCGRCVKKCPSSLNIVKVIKSLGVMEDVQL